MAGNTDDRLKKDLSVDVVGQRGDRRDEDRRVEDRPVTEDRERTDADRLEMFRNQLFNDALPDLPQIAGYHTCWLTTTNPRDPIHKRLNLGYELIRADEVPGLVHFSLKTGDYNGFVGVNEMVAARLPTNLYDAFMQEVHHKAPLAEEEKIREANELMKQRAEAAGAALIEDEGMSEMREQRTPARGVFAS